MTEVQLPASSVTPVPSIQDRGPLESKESPPRKREVASLEAITRDRPVRAAQSDLPSGAENSGLCIVCGHASKRNLPYCRDCFTALWKNASSIGKVLYRNQCCLEKAALLGRFRETIQSFAESSCTTNQIPFHCSNCRTLACIRLLPDLAFRLLMTSIESTRLHDTVSPQPMPTSSMPTSSMPRMPSRTAQVTENIVQKDADEIKPVETVETQADELQLSQFSPGASLASLSAMSSHLTSASLQASLSNLLTFPQPYFPIIPSFPFPFMMPIPFICPTSLPPPFLTQNSNTVVDQQHRIFSNQELALLAGPRERDSASLSKKPRTH